MRAIINKCPPSLQHCQPGTHHHHPMHPKIHPVPLLGAYQVLAQTAVPSLVGTQSQCCQEACTIIEPMLRLKTSVAPLQILSSNLKWEETPDPSGSLVQELLMCIPDLLKCFSFTIHYMYTNLENFNHHKCLLCLNVQIDMPIQVGCALSRCGKFEFLCLSLLC